MQATQEWDWVEGWGGGWGGSDVEGGISFGIRDGGWGCGTSRESRVPSPCQRAPRS